MCKRWGGPESLVFEELPIPTCADDEVLIEVKAVGINFPDYLMITGRYQAKPPFPFIPGGEIAGIVKAIGKRVTEFKIGDPVIALSGTGGLAEAVCTPVKNVFPISTQIDFVTAASFLVAYGIAYLGLIHRAAIKPGETLLVHGAGGGVGLAAVDLGACVGARVIANAGNEEKLKLAKEKGAEFLINYTEEDLPYAVKQITQNKGVDVIYDPVGGDTFDESLRCIAWEGRILVIGFASGRIPELSVNRLLLNNLSVFGVFLGAYKYHRPDMIKDAIPEIFRWYEQGKIRPYISHTFSIEEYAAALNCLADREVAGKVVVTL